MWLLVSRSRIAPHDFVLDGRTHVALPSPGVWIYPGDVDRPHHRALVATVETAGWAWMALDSGQLTALSGLEGLDQVVVAPSGLLALDGHAEPPILRAFDDRGRERGRLTLPWPRDLDPLAVVSGRDQRARVAVTLAR